MVPKHLTTNDLRGKTIDCHSHAGVGLKYYSSLEYPYGQTVEAIYYKQRSSGVDVNVVFPASASLFFDPDYFACDAHTIHSGTNRFRSGFRYERRLG